MKWNFKRIIHLFPKHNLIRYGLLQYTPTNYYIKYVASD